MASHASGDALAQSRQVEDGEMGQQRIEHVAPLVPRGVQAVVLIGPGDSPPIILDAWSLDHPFSLLDLAADHFF